MQEKKEDSIIYSPDSLLSTFSKGRMAFWVSVAVIIHVVLIAMLSLGYIRDTWINPEGAKMRKEQAEAQKAAELKKLASSKAVKTAPVTKPETGATQAVATASATTGQGDRVNSDQDKLDKVKNTPMGQRLTAVATSNEVPRQSSDLGLSIEDTNIR